jgi:hypothetical protein
MDLALGLRLSRSVRANLQAVGFIKSSLMLAAGPG